MSNCIRVTRVAAAMLLLSAGLSFAANAAPDTRNVLFIMVDDLRCELGAYGSSFIKTPNLDRLAARGSLFKQSYCQLPLCGPSRASVMTSLYPEELGMFNHSRPWRDGNPDVITLSQHFKDKGYASIAAGKIYHNGSKHSDDASWSDPHLPYWANSLIEDYRNPESLRVLREVAAKGSEIGPSFNVHLESLPMVPPYEKQQVLDAETTDGKIAQFGVDRLRRFKESGEPFFLALGFHKPHLSFNAPKKYWDLYDREALPPAPNSAAPDEYYNWYYDSWYIRLFKEVPEKGPIPEETVKTLRHAYFACVSFVDAQIGKVLDELELLGLDENTVVVVLGDHGYLLNDHGVFGKHNHFEQALRAPLIISAPDIDQVGEVEGPVEFVDIYPTVCELTGVSVPKNLSGRSQVEALRSGDSVRESAYSVYGHPDRVFSRSIRTKRYRYIEWEKNGYSEHRVFFDYEVDPLERRNLIGDPKYASEIEFMADELKARQQKKRE